MRRFAFARRESAFTLVEVVVSALVLAIITLGIVPLMASSMSGSSRAQMETAAENTTRRVLEHIEGINWYTGYDVQPPGRRVDLLDLYFPLGSGASAGAFLPGQSLLSGQNPPLTGTGATFRTLCPPPSGTNPACGFPLPPGYSATIDATFVAPNVGTNPETYAIAPVPSTYAWNVTGKDTPPAKLLDMRVTVTWTRAGRARTFQLRTFMTDRHFEAAAAADAGPSATPGPSTGGGVAGGIKISGQADVDYSVLFNTGFSTTTAQPSTGCPAAPCYSDLVSTFGISHSRISSQDVATASQNTATGGTRITRAYPAGQTPPASPPGDLAVLEPAAKIDLAAPPAAPATTVTDPGTQSIQVRHPDFASTSPYVTFIWPNKVTTTGVDAGLNPFANGSLTQNTTNTFATAFGSYQTQANQAYMHLNPNQGQLFVSSPGTTPLDLWSLSTSATTGAIGAANRGVRTRATTHIPIVHFLLVFLDVARVNRHFIEFRGFDATVDCNATGNPATATATASWDADLILYRDASPGDRKQATTSTTIPLGSTRATDPLAAYGTGPGQTNPLIYDTGTAPATYLFNDPATGKLGYLESWSSEINEHTSVSPDGRSASASINGAIRINTVPVANTGPANALNNLDTTMNLSIGKLSCNSVDNR